MLLKILPTVLALLFCFDANAKSGPNIFAYSRPAPQTPVYDKYGQKTSLEDFKGEMVLAVFWSRHCVPCIKELDNLNSFVNQIKDSGIRVLIISPEEEWTTAFEQKELLNKYGAPDLDYYTDKDGKLAGDFGIFSSPHTVLVNQLGEEFGRISGVVDWDDEDFIEYVYQLKVKYGYPENDE